MLLGCKLNRILGLYILPCILGLLLGFVTLTREVYALFPFLLFPALALRLPYRLVFKLRTLLIAGLVMCFTITPWIHRNYLLAPGVPFISKGIMGLSLYYGTWVEGGGSAWTQKWFQGVDLPPAAFNLSRFDKQFVQEAVVSRNDSDLKSIAIDSILNHPLKVFSNWIRRVPYMWFGTRSDLIALNPVTGSASWYLTKSFLYLLNLSFIIFGLLFLLVSLPVFPSSLLVLVTLPAYNLLIYLPFLNIETRYSHPSVPILILFSSLFAKFIFLKFPWYRT